MFSTLGLDDASGRPRRPARRAKSRSRASSPGAPDRFVVHVSDGRALELTKEALSVGTPAEEEDDDGPAADRGRRSSRDDAVNALGLHGTQDPLASPAVEPRTGGGFFSRWTAQRSRSMVHLPVE
jgi:hypothetical protein